MFRQSFLQNGAQKYNGGRSSLSGWVGTPQGAYVLDWGRSQFDTAAEDVFGFRAAEGGMPETDFLLQNRTQFPFTLPPQPGASPSPHPPASSTWCARSSALSACASSPRPGGASGPGGARSRRSPSKPTSTVTEAVVEIYSDGACRGNPGPGGWGAIVRFNNHEKELSGGERATTNNRMELTAVIRALESLEPPRRVRGYTDSPYVQKGSSERIRGLERKGWGHPGPK